MTQPQVSLSTTTTDLGVIISVELIYLGPLGSVKLNIPLSWAQALIMLRSIEDEHKRMFPTEKTE